MNLSMKWLMDFVDIDMPPRDFSEAMTMSGSKVERFEIEGENIKNIVVGRVLQLEKHPNADRLTICQIDVGETEPLQVVTAATNLSVGDLIPVAKDNSLTATGLKIKSGKLRGVTSYGMCCSLAELGLTLHDFPYAIEDGIFVLHEDCKPGQNIQSAIGLDDTQIEFEITSNRPDCFSVIGLAREAAATFDKPLKLHTPVVKAGNGDCTKMLDVKIENPDLCKLYSARIVKNVRVKPSPRWLRERLRVMGVRPINNIVDITNYVMLEYGQPMHAFDLRFIKDGKIRVRNALAGETITTLDGVERTLSAKNLVIADSEKPVAIAGVMGGEYSGIMDDTDTIVFESANFDGASVRLTAKEHGMRTDASSRYEKGLDPNNCLPALERACELVELLDAGDVMDGVIVENYSSAERHRIPFEYEWINSFLDLNLQKDDMRAILQKLECDFDSDDILVPTFRPDLQHKADIAEEIARFYGYNKIPSTSMKGSGQGKYSRRQVFDRRLHDTMQALGLDEIMTYSFISPKQYDKIRIPENDSLRRSVIISNPLGEDTSIMRTTALPSMLEIIAKNCNNRNPKAYLYEVAREYIPTAEDKLPIEKNKLVCGLYGDNTDFFTIKGVVEELLDRFNIVNWDIEASAEEPSYHPGRCAVLSSGDKRLGVFGEIHPDVAQNFGICNRIYALELDVDTLFEEQTIDRTYTPLPKYPATTRDLALLCDEDIPVLSLQKAMKNASGKILEAVRLFDVYQGEQIERGKKSVAFNLTFRSREATLTDEQIDSSIKKIIKSLEAMGATLRS